MARLARITIPGYPHLIFQRGLSGRAIFVDTADFQKYLTLLREYSSRYEIDVWGYCLVPEHIHVVGVPRIKGGLARCFNSLHMRYAKYLSSSKGFSGHLWMARFLSCMLDDHSAGEAIRHIEEYPVHAGYATKPEDYLWSSAGPEARREPVPLIAPNREFASLRGNRIATICPADSVRALDRIWRSLRTGRPVGADPFINELENISGRRLRALPRGRPRKRKTNELMGNG